MKYETATGNATEREPLEAQIALWWREGTYGSVVTTRGRVLQVLYPGRPSPGAGPDFQDALLITEEGEFVRGDLEVHVRQRDWEGHGHHRDPRYNRVVLHLFLQGRRNGHGEKAGTWLEEGTQTQEVFLKSPLQPPDLLKSQPHIPAPLRSPLQTPDPLNSSLHTPTSLWSLPLAAARSSAPPTLRSTRRHAVAGPIERLRALSLRDLERALDEAGERRFLGKALAMLERLRMGDAQEELYAGLMEALGYSRNRGTMLLLARGLSLRRLKGLIGPKPDQPTLEALLVGAAGLLSHQRGLHLPGWEERRHSQQYGDALAEHWGAAGGPHGPVAQLWPQAPKPPCATTGGSQFPVRSVLA